MKPYKAIIYDIDGTMLNTLHMNMIPLIRIIKEETGREVSFDEVLRYASYPGMKVMEELQVKDPNLTYARWVKYVNEYEGGATLYEGFEEVCNKLQQANIKQAVVSAKTRDQYRIDVESKALDPYFEAVVLADDTLKHKPDPEPLLECLRRLHLQAEEVIYIGDALSDYEAARNAGIDFGYATWGSVSKNGITDPTFIFSDPIELLQLIA